MRRTLSKIALVSLAALIVGTALSLRPVPQNLYLDQVEKPRLLDRNGIPLTWTLQNHWNVHEQLDLSEIPEIIRKTFVLSEDKRFYQHAGVDWQARAHAFTQNARLFAPVRGASTITEQVVRMLHPRPRTFWSRWIEGFEAASLERKVSKEALLEFYLNQVPFGGNRRGIAQAARFYFDRGVETLTDKEAMALAILVRNPTRYDLRQHRETAEKRIRELANRYQKELGLSEDEKKKLLEAPLELANSKALRVSAPHFASYAMKNLPRRSREFTTTLDAVLQEKAQGVLDKQIETLGNKNVKNGAVLIVDIKTGEILSWVVAGNLGSETEGAHIDTVLTPRQPGSTLKPFVYALSLEKGWNAATLIDDSPYTIAVGNGLHSIRNYSRANYGYLTLRESLANSLNVPAIKAAQFVGTSHLLQVLRELGMESLNRPTDFYGDGLALGNGEITLLELVGAYTALANKGIRVPLQIFKEERMGHPEQVFTAETASLISNILSDPHARRREFSASFAMSYPVQTAVKTGTSTDFRDGWAVGYNSNYLVGVWMGNVDQSPMDEVSGVRGPATVLRILFSHLNQKVAAAPLYLSPTLEAHAICVSGKTVRPADGKCPQRWEWFASKPNFKQTLEPEVPQILQPKPGVILAMDPRVSPKDQAFQFKLAGFNPGDIVQWEVNDRVLKEGPANQYLWTLQPGKHSLRARIRRGNQTLTTETIPFRVRP